MLYEDHTGLSLQLSYWSNAADKMAVGVATARLPAVYADHYPVERGGGRGEGGGGREEQW